MRTAKSVVLAALALGILAFIGSSSAEERKEEKPKFTIKQVMQKAHKEPAKGEESLRDKVVAGKASADEKKQLVEMYTALTQNKPPMGDEKAWKDRTTSMVEAAKKDDGAALKTATTCGTCHETFRPKK